MAHIGNPYQTRVGKPSADGAAFPITSYGDEVIVSAIPGHWRGPVSPRVTITVNRTSADLCASEARALARALLEHADQTEQTEPPA